MGVPCSWRRSPAAFPRSFGARPSGARFRACLAARRVDRAARADEGLADLHRLGLAAELRPGDLAAQVAGWSASRCLSLRRAAVAAAGRAGLDVPLRHRLDGQERPLGRRPHPGRAAEAAPRPEAHALRFVSAEEPYVDFLTLEQAGLHDVMLAYEMDGKPLPREHGAPLRLVIPEMYGYKNVKWLNGIELVPAAGSGYWEQLGYDRDAWVGRSNGYGA